VLIGKSLLIVACTLKGEAWNTHICDVLYVKTTLKLKINILQRYRDFISVQENHQQASLFSWDYPFKGIVSRETCINGQMPRIATTWITSWQTTLKWTADCQVPRSGCCGLVKPVAIHSQILTSVCGNPCDGYSILGNPHSKRRGLPQSVAHIWARTWQETEFHLPPFYINSSPVYYVINFWRATF
jgi:hypothetical protein